MIIQNSNINFTSRIRKSENFIKGINYAKSQLSVDNPDAIDGSYLLNAVNIIKNDGKDDVYDIVKDKSEKGAYILTRNDVPVYRAQNDIDGKAIGRLLEDYVESEYDVDVVAPLPRGYNVYLSCDVLLDGVLGAQIALDELKEKNPKADITKCSQSIESFRQMVNSLKLDALQNTIDYIGEKLDGILEE